LFQTLAAARLELVNFFSVAVITDDRGDVRRNNDGFKLSDVHVAAIARWGFDSANHCNHLILLSSANGLALPLTLKQARPRCGSRRQFRRSAPLSGCNGTSRAPPNSRFSLIESPTALGVLEATLLAANLCVVYTNRTLRQSCARRDRSKRSAIIVDDAKGARAPF
jgi:hypothetical protein